MVGLMCKLEAGQVARAGSWLRLGSVLPWPGEAASQASLSRLVQKQDLNCTLL